MAPTASIDKEFSELEEGMNVEHSRFGNGKVLRIEGKGNDKKALIDFENNGKKSIASIC